jgi:hypothetical protein
MGLGYRVAHDDVDPVARGATSSVIARRASQPISCVADRAWRGSQPAVIGTPGYYSPREPEGHPAQAPKAE